MRGVRSLSGIAGPGASLAQSGKGGADKATLEKVYKFTPIAGESASVSGATATSTCLYFDDEHIYFPRRNTAGASKVTLDRSSKTFGMDVSNPNYSAPSGAHWADSHFDIRVSDTLLVSSTNGRVVSRVGDTLSLGGAPSGGDFCVPTTGTHTIGSDAYTGWNGCQVRAIPDSTDFVVVNTDESNYTYSNVFVVDKDFNILRSARVRTSSASIASTSFHFITDNGTLLIGRYYASSSYPIEVTACDLSDMSSISRIGLKPSYRSGSIVSSHTSGHIFNGFYFDRNTNTIHPIYIATASNSVGIVPLHTRFREDTGDFHHCNGEVTPPTPNGGGIANVSVNVYLSSYRCPIFYGSDSAKRFMGVSPELYGSSGEMKYNKFGQPIVMGSGYLGTSSYPLAVPYAGAGFDEPTGVHFMPDETEADVAPDGPHPSVMYDTRYSINPSTHGPTYGYSLVIGTTPVPVGDDLYVVFQIRTNADSWLYCTLFERSVVGE